MLLEKIQLEADEKVLIQARRHWFIIISQVASLFFVALAPGAALLAASWFNETYDKVSVPLSAHSSEIIFAYCLWLLFLWFGVFNLWTNYYLDILTITDRRAILINQKGFFRRNVASFRLERLQDINVEINGLIPTLLDYGTIHAETAGHSEEEFKVTDLPSPRELKALIMRAADNRLPNASSNEDSDPTEPTVDTVENESAL